MPSVQQSKRIKQAVTSWDRLLWGVAMSAPNQKPILIGEAWHSICEAAYPGQPSRALLFNTRAKASGWCAEQHAKYAKRSDGCAYWRFRPIRVRESVVSVG